MSSPGRVVFAHGAFVRDGAWWWSPVATLLAAHGTDSVAVEYPSCGEAGTAPTGAGPGLLDDAAALRRLLDEASTPCTVVAHSYGGLVTAQGAAGHPNAARLVFVSSFLPRIGETLGELSVDPADPVPVVPHADGSVSVDAGPHFDGRFLHDVADGAVRDAARQRLTPQSGSVFGTPVTAAAWESVPTTYVVCSADRSTSPAVQRAQARRAGRTVEIDTGHHPMLSRPDLLAEIVATAGD